MALYKLIGENEALNPIMNYNGNSNWLLNQRNSLYGPTDQQTQVYNALGRNDGTQQGDENFFQKRGKSIENAFGTTGASIADAFKSGGALGIWKGTENIATADLLNDTKAKMNEVYKKFGFEGRDDYDRQLDAAEAAGDNNEVQRLLNLPGLQAALQIQANENANAANKKAADYEDYRKNNYAAQKVNQDREKFAGSAMNTLSTMADVGLMAAGVPTGALFNAGQGAWEGVADELEQNGKNFSWDRAGQNALIGAATGAVTGALNKGMSNALAKNGGNLLKGGNVVTRAINNFNKTNPIGKTLSTVGMGATRGAISGAVGGATGAGLSSALNNVDVGTGIGNALQGAVKGAGSGAATGGIMAGANLAANAALNKVAPNVANKIQENQMRNASYGDTLRDQFKGAWNSGDSATAEFLKTVPDRVRNFTEQISQTPLANVGMSIKNVGDEASIDNGPKYINDEFDLESMSGMSKNLKQYLDNMPRTPEIMAKEIDQAKYYIDQYNKAADKSKSYLGLLSESPNGAKMVDAIQELAANGDSIMAEITNNRMSADAQTPNVNASDLDQMAKNAGYKDKTEAWNEYAKYKEKIAEINNSERSTAANQKLAELEASGELKLNNNGNLLDKKYNNAYKPPKYSTDEFTEWLSNNQNSTQAPLLEEGDTFVKNGEVFTVEKGHARNPETLAGVSKDRKIITALPNGQEYDPLYEGEGSIMRTATDNTTNSWDTIAQEAGYKNYDEAVQSYTKANPNAAVDSGKVLDWLDNGSPETEVYRTVTGTNKKPLTGEQIKAKAAITEDIRKQLNPIDKPTTRRSKPNQTFYNLYDEWGLSDGNDIRQAVSYADPDGLIPTMIKEAAGKSGVIDLSDAQAMVMDLGLKKSSNYKKAIAVLSDIWDSMEDKTIIGGKSGIDALTFQREVEKVAADALGMSGDYHVGNNVVDKTTAKNLMKIADNIGDKLDEASIANNAVAETLADHAAEIQQMRNAFPNNPKWQESVDNKVSNAKTIRDLRSSIRDLTRANIYIENGDELIGTVGSTVAKGTKNIPTSEATLRNRLINDLYDKVNNSKAVREARIEANYKKLNGDNTNLPNTPVATTLDASTTAYNPATQLYNAIGRTEGATARDRAADYLAETAQEAEVVPNTATATTTTPTGSVANAITGNNASTSVYNALTGTSKPTTNGMTLEEERQVYFFRPTGDEWSDMLSRAMRRAKNAEDYDALGQLYEMYQDALAKVEKQNSATQTKTKLTDKQRQANAAALALEDFSKVEPNAAYDVSDIPFIGQIANFGGNEYLSKAEALALQLGYMLSGATVNKEEAKNIGMAYVPQPRDSQATRQAKLNQIRGIISEYQKTYEEA